MNLWIILLVGYWLYRRAKRQALLASEEEEENSLCPEERVFDPRRRRNEQLTSQATVTDEAESVPLAFDDWSSLQQVEDREDETSGLTASRLSEERAALVDRSDRTDLHANWELDHDQVLLSHASAQSPHIRQRVRRVPLDLRRAVLAKEILDPPKALRSQHRRLS